LNALLSILAATCATRTNPDDAETLVIAAYSAPREAFEKSVFPAFRADWRRQTGRDIRIRASYLGSGAQARAVTDGFPADVVVLALEPDVDKIAKAGLIASDWRRRGGVDGIVARTTVALAVRTGNPKGFHDFKSLGRPGIEVVVPNPMTSGAAIWTFLAVVGTRPVEHARDDITAMSRNVVVMDKGARESIINFERGIGDVAVTYEQETIVARRAGRRYDVVVPEATLIVEIPAAVVDRNVDARGTRKAAEAFVRCRRPKASARWVNGAFTPRGATCRDFERRFGFATSAGGIRYTRCLLKTAP
jgi:sulfate transport system substrate-binding protein